MSKATAQAIAIGNMPQAKDAGSSRRSPRGMPAVGEMVGEENAAWVSRGIAWEAASSRALSDTL
jgi:hypothetical protein